RSWKYGVDPAGHPVGQKARPFAYTGIGMRQASSWHRRKRKDVTDVRPDPPVDRIGFDRKSRLAEQANRARHVERGGDKQPVFAGLGFGERLREHRILIGITR